MTAPTALDAGATRAWVDAFVAELAAEREALGDLDRRSGDGDYGNNLKTALDKIEAALATADPAMPGAPFTALSTAFLGTGGTSGPLVPPVPRKAVETAVKAEPGADVSAAARPAAALSSAVFRLLP